MNVRELLHFFSLRCCNRAQWEIRDMAHRMLELARPTAPFIFADAGAPCVRGACPEGKMTCGNPYPAQSQARGGKQGGRTEPRRRATFRERSPRTARARRTWAARRCIEGVMMRGKYQLGGGRARAGRAACTWRIPRPGKRRKNERLDVLAAACAVAAPWWSRWCWATRRWKSPRCMRSTRMRKRAELLEWRGEVLGGC